MSPVENLGGGKRHSTALSDASLWKKEARGSMKTASSVYADTPVGIIDAFAKGEILQVRFFAA